MDSQERVNYRDLLLKYIAYVNKAQSFSDFTETEVNEMNELNVDSIMLYRPDTFETREIALDYFKKMTGKV